MAASGETLSDPETGALRRRLLRWYRREQRDLPWRRTDDLYSVLVSEFMLQQTRVATVEPYYARFMERFPDLPSLATASEEEVLAVWQGLGYYRRARHLLRAARHLAEHGPPVDAVGFRRLPGVGEYTAAALASRVAGSRVAAIDGNVQRVVARLFAVEGRLDKDTGKQRVHELAQNLVPSSSPGEWNQAMMELGARVCTAREPGCHRCPINSHCRAYGEGLTDRIPFRLGSRPSIQLNHICVVPTDGQATMVVRIPSGRWWAGLWEFPREEASGPEQCEAALRRLASRFGVSVECGVPLARIVHRVTHHTITLEAVLFHLPRAGPDWTTIASVRNLPMPTPQRIVVQRLEEHLSS